MWVLSPTARKVAPDVMNAMPNAKKFFVRSIVESL
jgi:hypothetical protein